MPKMSNGENSRRRLRQNMEPNVFSVAAKTNLTCTTSKHVAMGVLMSKRIYSFCVGAVM
jgi:hypothetical protein